MRSTSAPLIVWSVDVARIETLQTSGDWTGAGRVRATQPWRCKTPTRTG